MMRVRQALPPERKENEERKLEGMGEKDERRIG